MKHVLVIGSTVADIIVNLPCIPMTGEDVHITAQTMALGGCAYNVYQILRHFNTPAILFSPIGQGIYGDFVRQELLSQGIVSPIPSPAAQNGCCYCLVEPNGERTFLSYHGAEYRFQAQWFDQLDKQSIHSIYLCGLELEEETGTAILDFLETLPPEMPIYFAPGPRICRIHPEKMARALALNPILHVNRTEALLFSQAVDIKSAGAALHELTENEVIITLGPEGAYCHGYDRRGLIPGYPASVVDTIGAGDSHLGAIMACQHLEMDLFQSIQTANKVSAAVVAHQGAMLSSDNFEEIGLQLS